MTIDHSTDATSRDLTKERDEAQKREIERLRGEVRQLALMAFFLLAVATVCGFVALKAGLVFCPDSPTADEVRQAREACTAISADRDTAAFQAALYLDGWRQCVKGSGAITIDTTDMPPTSLLSVQDANGTQIGYVDLAGVCHGKLTKAQCEQGRRLSPARGSLLDPTRRIDR